MTNAPKAYGVRCLETLQLAEYFEPQHIFGVGDMMPFCKPESVAFQKVLTAVGASTER